MTTRDDGGPAFRDPINYAELFVVNGRNYGIEDYQEPGTHFFPGMPHKRFRMWAAGSSIGECEVLAEAADDYTRAY